MRELCPKEMSANVQRSSDPENVSVLGCINADGGFIPLLYIFVGTHRKMSWMKKVPMDSKCQVTKSSNITKKILQ